MRVYRILRPRARIKICLLLFLSRLRSIPRLTSFVTLLGFFAEPLRRGSKCPLMALALLTKNCILTPAYPIFCKLPDGRVDAPFMSTTAPPPPKFIGHFRRSQLAPGGQHHWSRNTTLTNPLMRTLKDVPSRDVLFPINTSSPSSTFLLPLKSPVIRTGAYDTSEAAPGT